MKILTKFRGIDSPVFLAVSIVCDARQLNKPLFTCVCMYVVGLCVLFQPFPIELGL